MEQTVVNEPIQEVSEQKVFEQKIKTANDDELRELIEEWFEKTRTDGLKLGAKYISAAIMGTIQKHVKSKQKASLRDYQRMTDDIIKIISVQITRQSDSQEDKS